MNYSQPICTLPFPWGFLFLGMIKPLRTKTTHKQITTNEKKLHQVCNTCLSTNTDKTISYRMSVK